MSITHNTLTGQSMFGAAAIEVHGDGSQLLHQAAPGGYPGEWNVVASHTSFTVTLLTGALNPVDLWSVTAPRLSDVRVTGNRLGRNLKFWKSVYQAHGRSLLAVYGMAMRHESSGSGFHTVVVGGNEGSPSTSVGPGSTCKVSHLLIFPLHTQLS